MSAKIESSLQDLYLKYRNKVNRQLENDSYFKYMLDLIKSGNNVLEQTNRIMHKNVDEKWLAIIEDTIPDIDAIINHPRRFINTVETVVPIELAKKIGAESVRHLAQNTKYISDIKDGMVVPKKILNISNEESYDLYENRFVNTLIIKLASFINKRTDVLFWSTGDERYSSLKLDSTVEDDYEEISYKLEINIKTKQSYMETDSQHMEVFKRIDRLRRIVKEFQRSTFADLMKGTNQAKSPIQRTNLIMKDPHYRKCYALWTFLERNDDVGYTIDVKENALEFDEEYLYQVYNNMLLDYTVFKSILSYDPRRIEEAPPKRRKILKPKFIKQIVEEFVDDYNIPDVEIRKVIIEEISKAQAEIEHRRAIKEKEDNQKAREKARKEREKAKEQARLEKEKEKARKEKEKAKEKELIAREKAKEKARLEKEKAKEKDLIAKEAIKAREKEKLEREKIREKERLAKELERAKEREKLEREKAKEKERLVKDKAKEQERLAKEAEIAREKEQLEREKTKEKERKAKAKAKEQERLAKEVEKAREKEQLEREKVKAKELLEKTKEQERLAKEVEKAKAKELLEREKAKEKTRLAREKAKEQERLAKEVEKAKAKELLEREKAKEKTRLAREKAKEREQLAKEAAKAKEKERIARERAKAKERMAKGKLQAKGSAKPRQEEEGVVIEEKQ